MMTQATLPKTHSVYANLLREVSTSDAAWQHNEKRFTAADLVQHIEQDNDIGADYARALITRTIEIFSPPGQMKPGITDNPDVSVSPRAICIAQFRHLPAEHVVWRTMSGNYLAGEMADLLEHTQDQSALQFVTEGLRLARDIPPPEALAGNCLLC